MRITAPAVRYGCESHFLIDSIDIWARLTTVSELLCVVADLNCMQIWLG